MKLKIENWKLKILRKAERGFSLIELMLTIGLLAVILPGLMMGFAATRQGRAQAEVSQQANALMREGQEATRVVKEADWILFSSPTNTPRSLVKQGNTWSLASAVVNPDTITPSGFTRTITVSDVYRNSTTNDIIATCVTGCYNDPSTKKATTNVSWTAPIPRTITTTEYLTRTTNTPLTQTGTVQPAASGFGNWCAPSQSPTTVDLSRQGVPTTVWAFEVGNGTGNRVFSGTGGNSSGPAFTNTKIIGNNPPTAPTPPPGNYNDTPKVKVNGEFGDANYAYITTDSNFEEVKILDLNQFTDPPTNSQYTKVGSFDSQGSTDGNSVAVAGNVGFMTAGDKFYAFDLSSKTGSRPQLGDALTLAGTGVKIFIVGQYAYVAISGSDIKMQIVNITIPTSLSINGSLVNANWGNGRDIYVNVDGTRAYLATAGSTTAPEFFIIDTSNKSTPTLISGGTYDTSGMDPHGVTVVTDNKAIIVGHEGSLQYQVIDITTETAPAACGPGLQINGGANAVSSILQSDGHAYSYVVSGDSNAELKIIEGGAGGGGTGNGIAESTTLDAGHDVAFNYFSGTSDPDLAYKIAIKEAPGGTCPTTWNDTDFVAISNGPIPIPGVGYTNPGQCMRYRVINTGTSDINYSVTINYSP